MQHDHKNLTRRRKKEMGSNNMYWHQCNRGNDLETIITKYNLSIKNAKLKFTRSPRNR